MEFIQTSLDILYISLAASVVLIALFICWTLFYVLLSLKDVRSVTRDVRERFERVWDIIDLLRDKLQVGSAAFKIAATGITELSHYLKQWTDSEYSKPKKKKKS